MTDYTTEDSRQAERIMNGLLNEQEETPTIDGQLVVSDLEADAADFNADLEVLELIGIDCPAARVKEDSVPVALSLLLGPSWPWLPGNWRTRPSLRHHPLSYEWLNFTFGFVARGEPLWPGFHTISREQARAAFSKVAVSFLATRIAALRERHSRSEQWLGGTLALLQRVGGPRVSTPGCQFVVSTNSPGLRVFWSGAYRISPNYFSHPTTPTVSVLQAGTYVFGVDGGAYANTVNWDTSAVVTLPGSPHLHLNF